MLESLEAKLRECEGHIKTLKVHGLKVVTLIQILESIVTILRLLAKSRAHEK